MGGPSEAGGLTEGAGADEATTVSVSGLDEAVGVAGAAVASGEAVGPVEVAMSADVVASWEAITSVEVFGADEVVESWDAVASGETGAELVSAVVVALGLGVGALNSASRPLAKKAGLGAAGASEAALVPSAHVGQLTSRPKVTTTMGSFKMEIGFW